MHKSPTAFRIDVDAFVAWLIENWIWPVGIVAVILLFVLVISLLPDAKIETSEKYPVSGVEARGLALGAIQLTTAYGAWNDPEASSQSKRALAALRETWGLYDRDEWLATIAQLPERRSDPVRDSLLIVRSRLADALGRRPTRKEWLAEAKSQGANDRTVIKIVEDIITVEHALRVKKLGVRVLPDDATIRSTRGYAYGQAVAVATWGVGLGLGTREEARDLIQAIATRARAEFSSWEEFGRSYLLGRALRLVEQGMEASKVVDKTTDGPLAYGRAFDPKRGGPWSTLPW